jgi:hypothetical protein
MAPNILTNVFPGQVPEDCVETQELKCADSKVTSDIAAKDITIEFPTFVGDTLPLAGGAIISLSISNLNIETTNAITNIITRELKGLDNLNLVNKLSDLVTARLAINKALFDVARRNIKVVHKDKSKRKAPEVYISLFEGDASELVDGINNPNIVKLCELRYVPKEVLHATMDKLVGDTNELFSDVIGTSGKTFFQLLEASLDFANTEETKGGLNLPDPSEAELAASADAAVDLTLELFPVINISEDDLVKKSGNPSIGGFYTIIDDKIYIKTPDLSGRDSTGSVSDAIITETSNLFVEVRSDGWITRAQIAGFKSPPIGDLVGPPEDFPTTNTLEIEIETVQEENNLDVYLSPLIPSEQTTVSQKRLETFSDYIEIFSMPLLTQPSESGRKATFDGVLLDVRGLDEAFDNASEDLYNYISEPAGDADKSKYGYPYYGDEQFNANVFFGEKNRPEILLTDSQSNVSIRKNDRRYLNPKSYGVIPLLTSNRPKMYEESAVPEGWIKTKADKDPETGNLTAKFNLSGINLEALGVARFAVYIRDAQGQVTRVSGDPIELSGSKPDVKEISPNGFLGSLQLVVTDPLSITLLGDDFGTRGTLGQVAFTSAVGGTQLIFRGDNEIIQSVSDQQISISSSVSALDLGFAANTEYSVTVTVGSETSGQPVSIYMSLDAATIPPDLPPTPAVLTTGEFRATDFRDAIEGIPLLRDGQSAEIRVKSKSKLFDGSKVIYAYLGFWDGGSGVDSALSKFALPKDIKKFGGESLVIPTNIEYQFSNSLASDFARISNKRATLKFPGTAYSSYNFSGLEAIDEAFIVFTNKKLEADDDDPNVPALEEGDYLLLKIGDNSNNIPAFINPHVVIGLAAEVNGKVISTFSADTFSLMDSFNEQNLFGGSTPTYGEISAVEKISRLAVLFNGTEERLLKKRYSVKVNSKEIKAKNSKSPRILSDGKTVVLTFDNVIPGTDGVLPVVVEKNDRNFNVKTSSANLYQQGTILIKNDNYEIDDKTRSLTINIDVDDIISGTSSAQEGIKTIDEFISSETSGAAFIGAENLGDAPSDNKAKLLFGSDKDGILYNKVLEEGIIARKLLAPANMRPTVRLALGLDATNLKEETILPTTSSTSVSSIAHKILSVKSGGLFSTSSYITDSNSAMLFYNINVQNGATVKFNVPKITHIREEVDAVPVEMNGGDLLTDDRLVSLKVGHKIAVQWEGSNKKDINFKFGEIVVKPRQVKRVKNEKGKFQAVLKIPETMAGTTISGDKCFDICVSTSNADRNRGKLQLGRSFVVDLDKAFDDLLFGPLKEGVPDITELIEKLAGAPLQFVNNVLDKAMAYKDMIQSFCDLSFFLLAELKINLNGFRVLMIPIQVILCIIDVICALLNPIKLAKAVIRLFQCLYDLILLLPQISIPAMLLRLIQHLLELIQCVIEKILFIVTAINEISIAIETAITDKNWPAVKALEEALSEYLFEIEADLQFLEPVLSILAIFLQLLQLAFRFPCQPSLGEGEPPGCVDGSMFAGIIAGVVAPDLVVLPDALVPVGQTYQRSDRHEVDDPTSAGNLIFPADGDIIGTKSSEETFLDSMDVDGDSLRGALNENTSAVAVFAPCFTKSTKSLGKRTRVKFRFLNRGETSSFPLSRDKFIDPNQTVDSVISLTRKGNSQLRIDTFGSFISPIDGYKFMDVDEDDETGNIKPLAITFTTPIQEVNEDTGQVEIVGEQEVTRTYDDIPSLAIMDDEFNVYFIEENGVRFNNDGWVDEIRADMINFPTAPKLKLSREEDEDTNRDGVIDEDDDVDEPLKVYDFPQLYFVDVRQAGELLSEACSTSSINTFLFDFADTSDTDDIQEIVEDSEECINTWLTGIRGLVSDVRTSQQNGEVPGTISINTLDTLNEEIISCLEDIESRTCRFVVNTLNTSFRIEEDDDPTPLEGFTDGEVSEDNLDGMEAIDPPFTGAREYAAGIGDSAILGLGETANIIITPRDSYDIEMGGDLSDRIKISIISDTTGDAEFVENEEGNIITKDGNDYLAQIRSDKTGEIRLRATICGRTIEALTFSGTEEDITQLDETEEVDCIPDTIQEITGASTPLGALSKVDRILTIFYVKSSSTSLLLSDNSDDAAGTAKSKPQVFGSKLEN